MSKKGILLFVMCLAVLSTAWAESVSESQARKVATDFMVSHTKQAKSLKMVSKTALRGTSNDKAAFYVFNAGQQDGYVIVAGDDRAPAVLGYSDKGTFDAQTVPEAMQELLDSYAVQIEALTHGAKPAPRSASGPAISPLLTAQWSQNAPFNTLLPILPNGNQAVAGCVATAMAQMMYYWKWPVSCTSTLPEYTSQSLGIYMPALEPVDFNWEAMQDSYFSTDTESDGAMAAAQLTLYCAQSVKMNFLYGSSGANTNHIPNIMSTYFGYKRSAHCEYRENFSTQSWADFIYSELAANRPVVYSGSKASGGHAFICDGYDGEGMFHINWGWSGMSNGYFLLNVLNPDAQGTGSANETYGYIYDQYVVCGIEPGESESVFALTAGSVALNSAVTTRASSNDNFMANVNGRFYNYTPEAIAVSFGWGLYQGDELLSVLFRSGSPSLPSGYYFTTNDQALNFGRGITSGTYRIVPIFSEYGANNWRPCIGADINYIEVTIDGDNCTIFGLGSAGVPDYVINDITYDGSMHHGRPVDIAVNMTNNGYTQNGLLHMFVNDTFNSSSYLGLEHDETGDIMFRFLPNAPGTYTCTFSLNQDGSDPIAQTTITVLEMPVANLSITPEVLNVTDPDNMIVTSDKYSVKLTITNNGTEVYNDDISVKLYKRQNGNFGSNVQVIDQRVIINPGETATMQFDMDNVLNGWDYFAALYFYSAGQMVLYDTTPFYTIVFPEEVEPEVLIGDVNDDKIVNISDVTTLIDYLLSGGTINEAAADVTQGDGINIADVTALIDLLLSGN